jgi:hypothetical protein
VNVGTRVLYLGRPGTVTSHDIDWSEGFAMPYAVIDLDDGSSRCCPIPDCGGRMRPLADVIKEAIDAGNDVRVGVHGLVVTPAIGWNQ